jgi:hypothetical protein
MDPPIWDPVTPFQGLLLCLSDHLVPSIYDYTDSKREAAYMGLY